MCWGALPYPSKVRHDTALWSHWLEFFELDAANEMGSITACHVLNDSKQTEFVFVVATFRPSTSQKGHLNDLSIDSGMFFQLFLHAVWFDRRPSSKDHIDLPSMNMTRNQKTAVLLSAASKSTEAIFDCASILNETAIKHAESWLYEIDPIFFQRPENWL